MTQGLILVILTLFAKLAGFFRDLVVSYYYGASNIVDAYVVATTIPMVVFSFLGTGIQTSFIPKLTQIKKNNDSVDDYISNMSNLFGIICIIASVLIILFTKPVVLLFASGFDETTMQLAISFTRFSIMGIIFSTLNYIYSSKLQFENKFIVSAIGTILLDGVVLVFVVLSHYFGIVFLPIGNVVGLVVQVVFIRLFVSYKHKWFIDIKNTYLKSTIKEIIPTTIGTSINQINRIVDQTIGSTIMVGAIAYLNYANKILGVIQGVFILTLITYFFPTISNLLKEESNNGITSFLLDKIQLMEFFVIPCTICFCVYANDIVELLFLRGNFTQVDADYTAMVLFFYSLELPFYAIKELVSRVFFADGRTKIPMINSAISLVINAGLNIILAKYIGLIGLPIATSIACIGTTIFIIIQYNSIYKEFADKRKFFETLIFNICFIIISVISYVIVHFIFNNLLVVSFKYKFLLEISCIGIVYVIVGGFIIMRYKRCHLRDLIML